MSGLFNQASLVLVPSGYKAGKVYSEVPTSGDGDLTFTRASDATRVNSDGEIEVVGSGVPRLDYSQGSCPALLLEPQRTNLQTYSNGFLSNWTKNDVNTSVGESTLISGETTILMTETATNAVHRVVSVSLVSLTIGSVYTISFYAKSNGTRNIGLRTGFTGSSANIIFNPNTQTAVSVPAGFTTNITAANDGYYRYSITATAGAASDLISVVMFDGTALVYTGTTESIYISAIQTELGSYPTSYIPTTSATVTRLADACSKTGISSLIGQTEGTMFLDFKALAQDNESKRLTLSDGTLANRITLATNDNIISGFINVANVTQYSFYESGINVTNNTKVAVKYAQNNFSIFINGAKYDPSTSGNTFASGTLTKFSFDNGSGSNNMIGNINQVLLFTSALTDAECIEITTL